MLKVKKKIFSKKIFVFKFYFAIIISVRSTLSSKKPEPDPEHWLRVIIIISETQDDEVGDGTTSVTVLASELIREAEKLIDMRIHPQTIIAGWRKATQVRLKSRVAEFGPD